MPTYCYHCDGCGNDFEKEQRITEAPTKKCPSCGRPKARRMIAGGNFILKGGGWYSDAYGLKSAKSDKPGGTTSGESSSGSSTSTSTSSSSSDKGTSGASSKEGAKSGAAT